MAEPFRPRDVVAGPIMHMKYTLAVVAVATAMVFAAPQGASALPQVDGAKQLKSSSVEKTHWHRGYYRRNYGYGDHRHYRRGPVLYIRLF